MTVLPRILVPVDFSDCSGAALDWALSLGTRLGSTIDVLHVHRVPLEIQEPLTLETPDGGRQSLTDYLSARATLELDRFVAARRRPDGPPGRALLQVGDPVARILEVAKSGDYDLVVMGTHGAEAAEAHSGSVTERVVRRASCPVLTVRAAAARRPT